MKRLQVNPEKCLGCRTCENACSFKHYGVYNPNQGNIHIVPCENAGIQVPIACRQCENPECLSGCKTGAISKNADGVVVIDEAKCVGCQMCVKACETKNIVFNFELKKAHKCQLCGGDPECVKYCPVGALVYVDVDDSKERKDKIKNALSEVFETENDEKQKIVKIAFEKEEV